MRTVRIIQMKITAWIAKLLCLKNIIYIASKR